VYTRLYHKIYTLSIVYIIPVCVYNIAMYSVKEAAEKLGLDTSHVRRLLAKGEIKGVKLARDWIVLDLSYKRKRKPKKR
jgi:excisionase family DNA binding protein